MFGFRKPTVAAVFLAFILSACGGEGHVSATSTSTTIFVDPVTAYLELQKSVAAIVSSEIAESQLGAYAAVVTEIPGSKNPNYYGEGWPGFATKRVFTLYRWKNTAWVEANSPDTLVDPNDGACEIVSRDFNGDGIKDFFVDFCGFENGWGQVLTSISGVWKWASFKPPPGQYTRDDLEVGADGLYIDKASGFLVGEIVEDHTPLKWIWDGALACFVPIAGKPSRLAANYSTSVARSAIARPSSGSSITR